MRLVLEIHVFSDLSLSLSGFEEVGLVFCLGSKLSVCFGDELTILVAVSGVSCVHVFFRCIGQ